MTTPATMTCSEYNLHPHEAEAFQNFMKDLGNVVELEGINQQLQQKYEIAKTFAETIVQCQRNILAIRKSLESKNCSSKLLEDLNSQLVSQQSTYREAILQLQSLRRETDHLKHGLQQARIKLVQKFRDGTRRNKENEAVQMWKVTDNFADKQEESGVLKESCKFNEATNSERTESASKDVVEEVSLKDSRVEPAEDFERVVVGEEAVDAKPANVQQSETLEINETQTVISSRNEGFKATETNSYFDNFLNVVDSQEFVDFMKTVPLTGDEEVDEEIFSFYRTKFNCK